MIVYIILAQRGDAGELRTAAAQHLVGEVTESGKLGAVHGRNIVKLFNMLDVKVAEGIGNLPEQPAFDRCACRKCNGGDGQIFLLRSWLFFDNRP